MGARSISFKYIASILISILVILSFVGVLVYNSNSKTIMVKHDDLGDKVSTQLSEAIDKWMSVQVSIAQLVAKNKLILEALSDPSDPQKLIDAKEFLLSVKESLPYCENVPVFIKLNDGETIDIVYNEKPYKITNGQFVIDAFGGKSIGKSTPDTPYVKHILNGEEAFLTQPFLSKVREVPVITVSVPVKKDGKLIGGVVLAIRINDFAGELIQKFKSGESGYFYILDGRGMMITHPKAELILNPKFKEDNPDIVNRTIKGETKFEQTFNKIDKIYLVEPVNFTAAKSETNWYLTFAKNKNEILSDARAFISTLLILGLISFVLLGVLIYFMTKKIVLDPLNLVVNALKDISEGEGDLTKTIDIKNRDEIGEVAVYFNKFTEKIREVVIVIKDTADAVASGNNELAATMQQMSMTTSDQNMQISSIASAMEEVSANTVSMTDNVSEGLGASREATEMTLEGQKLLSEIVASINNIKSTTNELGETINGLAVSSEEIGQILNVIDDIADQTNLLALNAAIEAARAGEAGRGFAVVADEVRKLAERTQSATSQIGLIINSLKSETTKASKGMKEAINSVDKGHEVVEKTSSSFVHVVESMERMETSSQYINSSIAEQSSTVSSINENIQTIAAGVEESTHAISEVARTVEDLQLKSEELQIIASGFKTE